MIANPDVATHAKSRPRWEVLLNAIYGAAAAPELADNIQSLVTRQSPGARLPAGNGALSERDVLLITYADQLREPDVAPLRTLARFCTRHLGDLISGVHILPFYPWTSDDGFSVKDYFAVEPTYGTWEDIAGFRPRFDLMFDAVFNHLSAQSDWFQRFLRDEPDFRKFFVTVHGNPDLSRVVRPRALPLLTEFETAHGPEQVWTTFSADQVDVNVRNPRVLLALLEALLFYVAQGARFIRLDAIAYLWKEIGTPCIHLPQTHAIIQLMRAVLDKTAPCVQLITETNVPHADNISYFGDGTNEAQLVYNFALPPLVLHALLRGDATYLTRWSSTLKAPSDRTTFFNFLASHDGIGLNPARGILLPAEIDFLVDRCQAHGGLISYKHNADGSKSPYEMNITYFDAINDSTAGESLETQVDRFMVAQAIMLTLAGVPGIYFHSLFGSRNDREAARQSGINRRINRQKLALSDLESELGTRHSLRAQVFNRYRTLLQARRNHAAFNPHARQEVLEVDARMFVILRAAAESENWVLCLHNLSGQNLTVAMTTVEPASWTELLRPQRRAQSGSSGIGLPAYGISWLAGAGRTPTGVTVIA